MANIPKKLHCIWFGNGKMNETMEKCLKSWSDILPDYEIKYWNENNVDIDCCPYVRNSYDEGHWSFVSDYFRFRILAEEGGIYLDSDVEVVKPLDIFLKNKGFATFRNNRGIFGVSAAVLGCIPNYKPFQEIVDVYHGLSLYSKKGNLNICTSTKYMADMCENHGIKLDGTLQSVNGFTIYPMDYLSPEIDKNGKILVTENTHLLHYYCNSWLTDDVREKIRIAYENREEGQVQLKLEK